MEIRPHDGPQTTFLTTPADIAIYGGSAGGGKSWGLLMDPLRAVTSVKGCSAVIFRRTTPSIRNPGSLWDESLPLYAPMGGQPTQHNLEWNWPGYGRVKFSHLEHEDTILDWHGAQVPIMGFDELTEFTHKQFFYMISRNRSTCGVKPYVRATCNPDADSWVAAFIAWWINPKTGFPIPDRAGVLRWFIRIGDNLHWANNKEDLTAEKLGLPTHTDAGVEIPYMPKSVTFIPADIYNNPTLLRKDPGYLANLLAQPTVDRERLLLGNWKIRPAAGLFFKRQWCEVIEPTVLPADIVWKRGWDLAATAKTQSNDPDWTSGTKIGRSRSTGFFYVGNNYKLQGTPQEVERDLKNTTKDDGVSCECWLPQDPGQAGKHQVRYYVAQLPGYTVRFSTEQGDKETRFGPFSSQAEAGNVKIVRGPWNESYLSCLEGFPEAKHDDDVDSTSRAFNAFMDTTAGLIDYYREAAEEIIRKRIASQTPAPMATLKNGGIRVQGPDNVNVIYDAKGRPIQIEKDGTFIVTEDHLKNLRLAGFKVMA